MIVFNGEMDPRAFKDVLGALITGILDKDPDAIYLDADLMSCIGTAKYACQHPDRAIQCGIAEANMIGVAAGLASAITSLRGRRCVRKGPTERWGFSRFRDGCSPCSPSPCGVGNRRRQGLSR